MTRVLIADDHAIVRRGLRQIILDEFGGWEIGEAGTADEVLRLVRDAAWDVVVLDISLPDRNGLDLLGDIKAFHPHLPVLILSMHSEMQYALRALKYGASGYVSKDGASTQLVEALRRSEEAAPRDHLRIARATRRWVQADVSAGPRSLRRRPCSP